jgi:hypothetical protein
MIDSEVIFYPSISGNTLQNVTRGAGGTIAAAHTNGVTVTQNQCILTANAAAPTLASPEGKRVLQRILNGQAFSFNGASPAVASAISVAMSGNASIVNSSVTAQSPNFPGSTIISSGSILFSGNAGTEVNSSNGLVSSSGNGHPAADIIQNDANISSSNLFNLVFNQSASAIQSSANQTFNNPAGLSPLNGATGPIVWVSGSLAASGNNSATVGSSAHPVVLIVNGSIALSGNAALTVYGLLYVTNSIASSGNGAISVTGGVAAAGSVAMSGNSTIYSSQQMLQLPIIRSGYSSTIITQEMFQ